MKIMKVKPDRDVGIYEEEHRKMLNETFAYDSPIQEMYAQNHGNCLFADIPQDIGRFQVSLAFLKQSSYSMSSNDAIRNIKENGPLNRLIRKWSAQPRSDCTSEKGKRSLGFQNLISAFGMISVTLLLYLLIFFLDICSKKIFQI